jgi:hypothetical protein
MGGAQLARMPELFGHDVTEQAAVALVALRDEGVVGHIGAAGGDTRKISRYVALGVFDAVLVHNWLTVVDRSASFAQAAESGQLVPDPEHSLGNNPPVVW